MLIRLGAARDRTADRHLAWSLAAIAGALNTAGFQQAGLYSSNMTGNVSSLASHLAAADLRLSAAYLSLVLTFIAGAASSALLINAGRRRNKADIYALSVLAEAGLLAALGCADLLLIAHERSVLLVYGLSFLMGLQNAIVTRISEARIRTTHVTGMATDIGIELGNMIDLAWQREHATDSTYNSEKLRLHGFTVLSFLSGGVLGVLAFDRFGAYFLLLMAFCLFLLAFRGILAGRAGKREGVLF